MRTYLATLLSLTALLAPAATGGTVRTTDGRSLAGKVTFDADRVVVTAPDGAQTRLAATEIAAADLTDTSTPTPTPTPAAQPQADPSKSASTDRGLAVEYFADIEFRTAAARAIEPHPVFERNGEQPDPAVPADMYASRWTATLTPPTTADYTFHVNVDDGIRLFIDDRPVIEYWHNGIHTRDSEPVRLEGGRAYGLRLDYFQHTGPSRLKLEWSAEGVDRQVVPDRCLTPRPSPAPPPGHGIGLLGEYFDDENFAQPKLVRIDPQLDFDLGDNDRPHPAIEPSSRTVRWTGQIQVPTSDKWTFDAFCDDGVRLVIDGKPVIDDYQLGRDISSGSIDLEAGRKYDVRVDYLQGPGAATMQLSWTGPNRVKQLVPAQYLYPPADYRPPIELLAPDGAAKLDEGRPAVLQARLRGGDGKVELLVGEQVVPSTTALPPAAQLPATTRPATQPAQADARPVAVTWPAPVWGVHALRAQWTDPDGVLHLSPPVVARVSNRTAPQAPWSAHNIGKTGGQGRASVDPDDPTGGTFTLTARGLPMWGDGEDGVYYVAQVVRGDFDLTARVPTPTADTRGVVAGLMLRGGLDANARFVFAAVGEAHQQWVISRKHPGSNRSMTGRAHAEFDRFRLSRRGKTVRVLATTGDASPWEVVDTIRFDLGDEVHAGLAVSSGSPGIDCVARFEQVTLTPAAAPVPRGVQLTDGSILAGEYGFGAEGPVKLRRKDGKSVEIPADRVARFVLRPTTLETLDALPPTEPGAQTDEGDFLVGSVEILGNNKLRVDSILFGPRELDAGRDTTIVSLRPVDPPARYAVRLTDGSLIHTDRLTLRDGKLTLPLAAGDVELSAAEVTSVQSPE